MSNDMSREYDDQDFLNYHRHKYFRCSDNFLS